jgi:transporter family protein
MLAQWQFWALLSAVFAALTAVLAKIGVEAIDSNAATLFRTVIVLAFAGAIVLQTGSWTTLRDAQPRSLMFLAASGLATGLSWLCYFRALQMGDAARVAPVDKLSVVFVAVIAFFVLGEKLDGLSWLGVVLVTAGVGLLAWRA